MSNYYNHSRYHYLFVVFVAVVIPSCVAFMTESGGRRGRTMRVEMTRKKSTNDGFVKGVVNSANGYVNGSKEYSRLLVKRKHRKEKRVQRQQFINRLLNKGLTTSMDEDGYGSMMKRKNRSLTRTFMRAPFTLVKRIIFPEIAKEPGTLILVRHGESEWNSNKTFTGWADPDLSERGYREIEYAARLLLEGGYEIDVVFTSRLKRAIRSVWLLLQELNEVYLPVFKSWRLNERMYGALTGLSKAETAKQLGTDLVQKWRGSLRSRPPSLSITDKHWPGRDRRYSDLSTSEIPMTESLLDCMERTIPVWEDRITYELRKGNNVMVVAHANTLRGLVKIIDGIGDDEIQEVSIPTGIPIIYKFNNCKELKPVDQSNAVGASQMHMKGLFLEKPGLLKEALKRETDWCSRVPGYESTMSRVKTPMTPLERSLNKLKAERELGKWAGQFIHAESLLEDDGSDGNNGMPISFIEKTEDDDDGKREGILKSQPQQLQEGVTQFQNPNQPSNTTDSERKLIIEVDDDDLEEDEYDDDDDEEEDTNILINNACTKSMPSAALLPGLGDVPIRRDAVIVMIRHGKTEHNKLGLFTGWEDAPLAPDGVEEAKLAGKLLKSHGFEFDVVYTSWLSRAIETAWYVLDELGCIWLPIVKSWRLNERMYGDLTGLSKRMVAQRYGDKQFKAWRRGFKVRPPKVSSFSPNYPGNDKRYQKYLRDVRFSVGETLIRSIEGNGIRLYRKLPKTESLHDCMKRTIPYFSNQIVPEAINEGKRVLISSSENAIRGLLMYLCEIPEEKIVDLEIPNGLPLIFDVKSKCLKLLDDGSGRDPLQVYNFGDAASYLFKPCLNDDGTLDEECDINLMFDDDSENQEYVLSEDEKRVIGSIKGSSMMNQKENIAASN